MGSLYFFYLFFTRRERDRFVGVCEIVRIRRARERKQLAEPTRL